MLLTSTATGAIIGQRERGGASGLWKRKDSVSKEPWKPCKCSNSRAKRTVNSTSVVFAVGFVMVVFVSWAPLRVPFYRVKEADRGYNGLRGAVGLCGCPAFPE